MRLVEIVRGGATGTSVLATALAFAKRLNKVGVAVRNGPGFVGNRMMFPYMYEAQFLVEDGATPEQVDRVLTDWGMAMGIFAVDDMGGLDVAWRVRQELHQFEEPGARKPLVADVLVAMGRLGQKTGKGWYRYAEDRKPIPDPEVVALIEREATKAGIVRRAVSDEEIRERAIYALINEGARVLEDGIASRAADIDVIYLTGYGFPAIAAARCSAPIRSASRRFSSGSRRSTASSASGGRRRRCSCGWRRPDRRSASSTPHVADRVRAVNVAAPDIACRRSGDVVYMQSRRPLGAYPGADHRAPGVLGGSGPRPRVSRPARRHRRVVPRHLRQTLARVRAISQALLDRRLSSERPILILSGNSIEHGLLALAAMFSGVLYAPIAPAYSLQAQGLRHARPDFRAHATRDWCSRPKAPPSSGR